MDQWRRLGVLAGIILGVAALCAQTKPQPPKAAVTLPIAAQHTFALGHDDFLLDGKPFQIMSCEMHPARIPVEYWRHRIQMAKAMGCNTIAAYVFWNYHEPHEGVFDFTTGNHDLARFFAIAKQEQMLVILRPGPYVCAEWDFGGIPPYLLSDPELRVRSMYPRYIQAADRYITRLAAVITSSLVTHGGPIVMVQIENEYGSYGNDRSYTAHLKSVWTKSGINVPFYTADGPTPYMLEAGHVDGAAVGLDSGSNEKHWELARSISPGVPVFSSETYPGWLTHWGEKWAAPGLPGLLREVTFLLDNHKSFNFYVAHGGTNFGFSAGANSGGKGYEPDVTSYDYDAPIDEQGRATPKYMALRDLIGKYLPSGATLPPVPAPIPSIAIPEFAMASITSIWSHLAPPVTSVTPRTFESLGQNQGLVLYRTTLVGRKSGKLTITDLHDFALVFVDHALIGTIDRRLGEKTIDLPATTNPMPVLDILVEGMGHINFSQDIIDRKGITDRVTLAGMTLMNWQSFLLPLDDAWMAKVFPAPTRSRVGGPDVIVASSPEFIKGLPLDPGTFFSGSFSLDKPADTYIDMTGYRKGVVWVNGHNLGRYWDVGPQMRFYCPAPWLKAGRNDVIVLDLLKTDASPLRGVETLK